MSVWVYDNDATLDAQIGWTPFSSGGPDAGNAVLGTASAGQSPGYQILTLDPPVPPEYSVRVDLVGLSDTVPTVYSVHADLIELPDSPQQRLFKIPFIHSIAEVKGQNGNLDVFFHIPPGICHQSCGLGHREPCPPATTGNPKELQQSSQTSATGSSLLGLAFPTMETLAIMPHYCQARNGHPMTSSGFQNLVEMEISKWQSRQTKDQQ